jgi:hypothetical protein
MRSARSNLIWPYFAHLDNFTCPKFRPHENPYLSHFPALAISTASGAMVNLPYFQDFSIYRAGGTNNATVASDTEFQEFNGAYLNVVTRVANNASTNMLRARMGSNSQGSASIQSNLPGGTDFFYSSKVTAYELDAVGDENATSLSFSLVAAASTPTFTSATSSNYRLMIDWVSQSVSLLRAGQAVGTSTGTLPSFLINTQLTMSITGVYTSGTSVDLLAEITDGTNTYAFNYTDTNALTGNYFGLQTLKNGSGDGNQTAIGVYMDDITLIPEPSAALLAAIGLGGFASCRRRR